MSRKSVYSETDIFTQAKPPLVEVIDAVMDWGRFREALESIRLYTVADGSRGRCDPFFTGCQE